MLLFCVCASVCASVCARMPLLIFMNTTKYHMTTQPNQQQAQAPFAYPKTLDFGRMLLLVVFFLVYLWAKDVFELHKHWQAWYIFPFFVVMTLVMKGSDGALTKILPKVISDNHAPRVEQVSFYASILVLVACIGVIGVMVAYGSL